MNKTQIIKKCNDAGVYHLRHGETAKDALDYIDGELPSRKGYQYRKDNPEGTLMNKNEIISASNREAFMKSLPSERPEYQDYDIDDIKEADYIDFEDYRNNLEVVGELQNCEYCGAPLHVDKGSKFDIINCEECHLFAIADNCM